LPFNAAALVAFPTIGPPDFVHVPFLISPHVGKADELRLTVVMGLRKGLSLIRGMRRSLTEEEQHKIAGIIEQMEKQNWKIEHRPPGEGHGPHLGGDNYLGRSATIILAGRFGRERRL
jgi:hypothetical protein